MIPGFIFIVSLLLVIGVVLFWVGVRKFRSRRILSASWSCLFGSVFLGGAILVIAAGANLYTYQRLVNEQFVGIISVKKVKEGTFSVVFKRTESVDTFELAGDEWQLDSQILKWKGVAYLVGFDTVFRLDRISGRFQDIEIARKRIPPMFSLASGEGLDLWQWVHRHSDWVPWVDAVYGNAVYMPLKDGAKYEVQVGLTGLIARPLNDPK